MATVGYLPGGAFILLQQGLVAVLHTFVVGQSCENLQLVVASGANPL